LEYPPSVVGGIPHDIRSEVEEEPPRDRGAPVMADRSRRHGCGVGRGMFLGACGGPNRNSSCPGLTRASTSCFRRARKAWMAGS